MYETLVASLRNVSEYDSGYAKLMYDASDAIEAQDRHILTIQHEMMAEAESHTALVKRLNEQIEELQADVRPIVRGEWEKTEGFDEYGGGRYVEWTCSVCFSKAKGGWAVRDKHIDEPPYWNYCPNCGADMMEPPKEDAI